MFDRIFAVILALAVITTPVWYTNVVEAQIVTDGLVSYWTFDHSDVEGETVKDLIGNSDGVMMGGTQIDEDGKIEEALKLGVNDFVDCGNDTSLDITDEITIEAWIKLDNLSSGYGTIVGNWTSNAGQRNYILQTNNDKLEFYYSDGGASYESIGSTTSITTEWTHVVALLEPNHVVRQYINGVEDAKTATFNWPINNHVQNFYIGKWGDSDEFFRGALDEVKIYNRALSEDEIQQNYKAITQLAAVEPANKFAATWGSIKRSNR